MAVGPSTVATLILSLGLLNGCESTQEKSAKLEAQGSEVAKVEKIKIGATNQSIDLVETTLLTDQYGSAVVLRLKNSSPDTQVEVPVGLVVKNGQGKALYRNDIQGLEDGLIRIPIIEGNSESWWVHDQVLVAQIPKKAEVTLGKPETRAPAGIPKIVASPPVLETDPVSGVNVTGKVTNRSNVEQIDLLLYAVATKGGNVVAAGRGLIPKLKTDGKPEFYRIYFIGDPKNADIEVIAMPSNFE
ncbi:MAG: hypothetical protein WD181_02740 [Solirubrobacterales bacterium]